MKIFAKAQRLRCLWACTHVALRYEEVPAAIEAGFEVIPSLGTMSYLPFDKQYENENSPLYPDWKSFCTLPINIVEALRRIQFDCSIPPILTDDEKQLFNTYIDVIYIASMPASVAEILSWFKGMVVFRSFGRISNFNSYSELCATNNINLKNNLTKKNYIFLPIFSTLLDIEDEHLSTNNIILRAFVSPSRIPFKWSGSKSLPYVTTIIKNSAWEAGSSYETKKDNLVKSIQNIDCTILGKNFPNNEPELPYNYKFSGFLQNEEFFSTIAASRIFIYIGNDPYHLHFTPLEAICMGVPILFHKNTPLCEELLRLNIIKIENINEIGAYASYEEIFLALRKIFNNFELLHQLSENQAKYILPLFSKEAAIDGFKKIYDFVNKKQRIKFFQKYIDPKLRPHPNRLSYDMIFPKFHGQYMKLDHLNFPGQIGTIVQGREFGADQLVRTATGKDAVPGFLGGMYQVASPGEYNLRISLLFETTSEHCAGYLEVGIFDPQFNTLIKHNIFPTFSKNFEEQITFTIMDLHINKTLEIRLFCTGIIGVTFLGGRLNKL